MGRRVIPVVGASLFLWPMAGAAANQRQEKHFAVKGRPVVVIQNVANGRIEVKSSKNAEVVVISTQASDKVSVQSEQAGDRIDVTTSVRDSSAPAAAREADLQLIVPEETELQLRTDSGLIYIEQVVGDMHLQSYDGNVHLKEVSGYIIVRTTVGSLECTQCAGKLDFTSVSGNAQIFQPALNSVNIRTMSGNVLFDGDFIRTGLYSMNSGKGLVEVRFSTNDSFDLNAQTATGTVENRAEEYLKPDSHGVRRIASKYAKGLFGTIGQGLAKVELSSYSGTIRILKRD